MVSELRAKTVRVLAGREQMPKQKESCDQRLLSDLYDEHRLGWDKLLDKLGLPRNIGIVSTMTLGQAKAFAAARRAKPPPAASESPPQATTTPQVAAPRTDELANRVLAILKEASAPLKAQEILAKLRQRGLATALQRTHINSVLYGPLRQGGLARVDAYRWSLADRAQLGAGQPVTTDAKGSSEPTDVPIASSNVNKPCIFSVIGPHGGESLEQIFARKIEDTLRCKHTYWLARSESCSPQIVQQLCTEGPVACYFLEPASSGGARPAVTAESAKEHSPDGRTWASLHKDLSPVTGKVRDGKAWALVLDRIVLQEGDTTVDVSQFNDVRTGEPARFKLGASTICAVPGKGTLPPRARRVAAIAQLTAPYCVWLR